MKIEYARCRKESERKGGTARYVERRVVVKNLIVNARKMDRIRGYDPDGSILARQIADVEARRKVSPRKSWRGLWPRLGNKELSKRVTA